ncbi:hypothetical protein [Sphingomonas elodea]|uniref:hypothetical protein n=1 Tax=Sphingomonas elodea TaxID=179878 RepID=UPI0002F5E0BD|nr:hypothetical protein [Sphingomonas elodea]
MKKKHLLILGVVPIFALAACGSNTTTPAADNGDMVTNLPATEAPADNMAGMNGMDGNSTAAVAMSGQDFANTMAVSDAYEVAAGKFAQQKATFRRFATSPARCRTWCPSTTT